MKNLKRVLCALLALVMVLGFVGCKNNGDDKTTPAPNNTNKPAESEVPATAVPTTELPTGDYNAMSAAIYDAQLGAFNTLYQAAKEETNVSKRYALMAQAEAKLLEAAVLIPGTTNGGNYGLSRVAKRSASTVLWGNDSDRFHNVLVTTELITAEDQTHLKAMWNEVRGTGTYTQKAIDYLTEKGYTLKNTYNMGYASDPKTWDALATSRSADSEAIVNTYDGLVEYDNENEIKPALAESWEVSEDGLTYTFHIRQGAKWVDAQGREVADVKADDFVAGMQHMLDAGGGLEYLVENIIVNALEYNTGDVTDFAEVGVKATDDNTVVYTLCQPTSYFITMLGYNVFAPMSRTYFESKGGVFGKDDYKTAVDAGTMKYGQTVNDIAYCGPYTVTNHTAENTIVFEANPTYWNKDNITIKTLTWKFNDGKDPTKAYEDTKAGTLDGCGLSSASLEACKADGNFEKYCTVSDTDATSFVLFLNLNRNAYANFNDETKAVSTMTDDQKKRTDVAMLNVHFRRAIGMGLDIATYNGQVVGEELKLNSVRNSYTPGNFVALEEDVTVEINGESKTFAKGTYYGEIMQAQIDADGVKIKVWDAENQTSDGFAGWHNPANAYEELQQAITELKEFGVEISKDNPIVMDLPYYSGADIYSNRAQTLKQSVEEALQGCVVVNLVSCADAQEWYYAGYYTESGKDANYTLYDVSGWGPDYGDPATYLDTMLGDGAGYMAKCLGLF
ncbi:MAG: peptide ABC transporter substrate-binding protein [Eubacteriales bacterium]|nr:peptide ABC transporter substrate-binding protein [Eubacteriales bacterium]